LNHFTVPCATAALPSADAAGRTLRTARVFVPDPAALR
jgi:hypothetical protein